MAQPVTREALKSLLIGSEPIYNDDPDVKQKLKNKNSQNAGILAASQTHPRHFADIVEVIDSLDMEYFTLSFPPSRYGIYDHANFYISYFYEIMGLIEIHEMKQEIF